MFKKLLFALFVTGFVTVSSLVTTPASAQEGTDPEQARLFIEDLAAKAMDVLNNSNLSQEDRENEFRALLEEGFYITYIRRLVLGHHYQRATEEQRDEYNRLFPEYIIRLYAQRLTEFGDEKFTVTDAQPSGKRDVIVNSNITRPQGAPIGASWRVRNVNGEMKIVDIVVAGMSQVINQKKQFSSIIPREGFEGLLQKLRSATPIE